MEAKPTGQGVDDCRWPIHRFAMRMLRRLYYEAQQGRCGICGAQMKRSFESPKLTFDHVWPKSWAAHAGGAECKMLGNLLLAHAACNTSKDDAPPTPGQVEKLHEVNRAIGLRPHETWVWDDPSLGGEVVVRPPSPTGRIAP